MEMEVVAIMAAVIKRRTIIKINLDQTGGIKTTKQFCYLYENVVFYINYALNRWKKKYGTTKTWNKQKKI